MNPERKLPARAGILGILLLCGAAAVAAPPKTLPLAQDVYLPGSTLPNLYQRTGKVELALLGVVAGPSHYAHFRVEEVFSGDYDLPEIFIVYRGESWGRRVEGRAPIKFEEGERYILFLNYYREKGEVQRPNLFELADGDWGKVKLTGEDQTVYVEAMRLLIGATARPTTEERRSVLIGLMGSPNYLAAGAAMYQAAELGLGSIEQIPVLLKQIQSGHSSVKASALRIIRRMGPTLPGTLDRSSVAEAVFLRVGWDGGDAVEVRVEAVRALQTLGPDAIPFLQQVSRDDADQMVRYRAAVAAVELAPKKSGS